jgi:hypothetical protein
MNTYRKFSDLLINHESCGATRSKLSKASKAIKPDIDTEPSLGGLGALGGVPRTIQDSPPASVAANADENEIAEKEARQDRDFVGSAPPHLKHLNQLNFPRSRSDTEQQVTTVGVDTPRDWVEGLARLNPDRAPADVAPKCWRTFVDDIRRFLDGGWAEKAAALGWGSYELFGADRDRPFARLDKQGLCWFIKGGRLVGLSSEAAVVETCSGARQTYRRKPTEAGRALAWDLADTMSQLCSHCGPESQGCRDVVGAEIEFPTELPDNFGKNRDV